MDALRDRWGADALQASLQRAMPGLRVLVVPSVGSTSSALLDAARVPARPDPNTCVAPANAAPPCLLVAQTQTQGRGRMGRTWVSAGGEGPAASLTFSLATLLAPPSWSGLSLAVGVALAQALEPDPPPGAARVGLKWPNDLWLADAGTAYGGRKLGGILIETVATPAGRVAVVGVGLNVQPLLVEGAATGVASWSEIEPDATPPALLHRVAPELVAALGRFERHGLAPFMRGFELRDILRGLEVSTTSAEGPRGRAEGIDADGALRVRQARGPVVAVTGGEISVRPVGSIDAPASASPEWPVRRSC